MKCPKEHGSGKYLQDLQRFYKITFEQHLRLLQGYEIATCECFLPKYNLLSQDCSNVGQCEKR